jgi:hypothetical protein
MVIATRKHYADTVAYFRHYALEAKNCCDFSELFKCCL